MTRLSQLSSAHDFETENRREELRDRRWRRRCRVALGFATALAVIGASVRVSPLLPVLIRLI